MKRQASPEIRRNAKAHLTRAVTVLCLPVCLLAIAPPALAHDGHDHGHHAAPQTVLASGQGVVEKIDLDKQRLTLSHDPIPTLNWPGMTMPFNVADPALLKNLKVGDKVAFDLADERTIGQIRVQGKN
ncbi:MAG: copper-binding protein [Azoarcus sp.]|jgi:Cu/Ag efflux protein CusF|nr:copper-binding protein [Azoarcus sp.]